MNLLQLDPPIPVDVVGRGKGLAHVLIDYGPEFDLLWVVFLDATGECWTVNNRLVRGQTNETMGRMRPAAPTD